jgi:hypothetical protein
MAKVGCVCIEVVYIIFFGQNASNNDSKPRKLYLPWLHFPLASSATNGNDISFKSQSVAITATVARISANYYTVNSANVNRRNW